LEPEWIGGRQPKNQILTPKAQYLAPPSHSAGTPMWKECWEKPLAEQNGNNLSRDTNAALKFLVMELSF
jgi:hypothetical protein